MRSRKDEGTGWIAAARWWVRCRRGLADWATAKKVAAGQRARWGFGGWAWARVDRAWGRLQCGGVMVSLVSVNWINGFWNLWIVNCRYGGHWQSGWLHNWWSLIGSLWRLWLRGMISGDVGDWFVWLQMEWSNEWICLLIRRREAVNACDGFSVTGKKK